jgi:hypothetical protein
MVRLALRELFVVFALTLYPKVPLPEPFEPDSVTKPGLSVVASHRQDDVAGEGLTVATPESPPAPMLDLESSSVYPHEEDLPACVIDLLSLPPDQLTLIFASRELSPAFEATV